MRSAPLLAQIPNLPTKAGLEGVGGRESAKLRTPIRNPPIRNLRNPLLLERWSQTVAESCRRSLPPRVGS
eukprot:11686692-Alexandrium_andersonii.AAC.1